MGQLVTVFGRYAQKNTGLQGSTLSGPRMTTGFSPFELPTRGLLQKGRDHSPPKVCFEEPSFWLAHSAMGIHSAINILIIYLFSVNTFTPIERCAIIFVIAQVGKILIGQKIQKLQNHARCNRLLIGQ